MKARRLRLLVVGLALTFPAFGPAVAGTGVSCAAVGGAPHAALVIDNGSRTSTYCVALDDSSVSGLHLIQLAGRQYGLQYGLGFGGQAVCQLDGTGPSGGDCFADYPDYWGYWHGDGDGNWSWAGSGAASASIGEGDMEGWVWGPGDSGTTHASPPALAFGDVCEPEPEPSPSPAPSPSPSLDPAPAGGGTTGSGSGGSDASPGADANASGAASPAHASASARANAHATRTPSAEPTPSLAQTIVRASPVGALAAGASPGSGGPPAGALLALIAVAALGAAGWLTMRRRRALASR
ncbi:MAG: hypothetical protein ABI572_02080 [Actinomycetota bacterium]